MVVELGNQLLAASHFADTCKYGEYGGYLDN